MAGLVPAIHVFSPRAKQDVDARDEPGHDELCAILLSSQQSPNKLI
jgi:hypothetical protein